MLHKNLKSLLLSPPRSSSLPRLFIPRNTFLQANIFSLRFDELTVSLCIGVFSGKVLGQAILHLVHLNVIEADSNAIHHSEAELNWALNPAGQAPQHKERIPLLSNLTQDLL